MKNRMSLSSYSIARGKRLRERRRVLYSAVKSFRINLVPRRWTFSSTIMSFSK